LAEHFGLADDATLLNRRARRRLVGAIALVVFVVIVLPIVLDQQPRPVPQNLTVQIPSQDGGPFNTRVLPPLPSPPVAQQKSEPSPKATPQGNSGAIRPGPKVEAATGANSRAAAKSGVKSAAKESAKVQLAEARRAEALLNDAGYIVPLGAYANPENAKQVRDKAAAAGFDSYTEKVEGPKGEQTRVRAGPFQSKAAAEKAREKLKSLGLTVGQVAQR
jgi:DedD protein